MQEREERKRSSINNSLNGKADFGHGRADARSQKMLLKLNISLSVHPTSSPASQLQSHVLMGGTHLVLVTVPELEMRCQAKYESLAN